MSRHIPAMLLRLALAVLLSLGAATSVQAEAACAREIVPQTSDLAVAAAGETNEDGQRRQSTPDGLHCAASHCASCVAIAEPPRMSEPALVLRQDFAPPTPAPLETIAPGAPERPPQG